MDVPQDVINKWQSVWQQICDMAYYRNNVTTSIFVETKKYTDLLKYMINSKNFDQITLDYMWKQVSSVRGVDGNYIEPCVVSELTQIYIPRILFDTLGVYAWFKHSFPNCVICFWEDDM